MSVTSAKLLKDLLRPLGIYDVDDGLGAWELEALGQELDKLYDKLLFSEHSLFPQTAGEEGLALYEYLLPFAPHSDTLQQRREAVCALLQLDGFGFSEGELNRTLAGCGIRAVVEETDTPMTVTVSFPYNRGEPDDFSRLRRNIEQILPCHLDVVYMFVYATWAELEALFATWADAEAAGSWREIERVGGEAA